MQTKNQNTFVLLCFIALVSIVFGKPHAVLAREHAVSNGESRLVKRVPVLPVLAPILASITGNAIGAIIQHFKDENKLGNSLATYLELMNDSDGPLIIEVSEVDNYDWDGDSRPDHTFQKAEIPPRNAIKHRQEINAKSGSAMSTMRFFQDGQEAFAIRINQWAAKSPKEEKQDFDLQNGWKAHMTIGINGDTLQYRFEKP